MDWLHDSVDKLRAAYEKERRKPIPAWAGWDQVGDSNDSIRILRHRPPNSTGIATIVYFHGGGWIVGSPETHADITAALSLSTGCELISVDYRLAPEHVAPAPVIDGLKVLEELFVRHPLGVPRRKIILCGDSAGGAIALAVERAASNELRRQLLGVCSFYGGFGFFTESSLVLKGDRIEGTDKQCLLRYWSLAHGKCRLSPYSLNSLAQSSEVPVYLLAAAQDPMRDDTLELLKRLLAVGRSVTLDIADGETHGFLHKVEESYAAAKAIGCAGNWINSIAVNEGQLT